VQALALAGVAAGADGLIIEVHPTPKQAKSDAAQQLTPAAYAALFRKAAKVAEAVGRAL
jgi:3-deoxy-7-phosphoheptulonate synthase